MKSMLMSGLLLLTVSCIKQNSIFSSDFVKVKVLLTHPAREGEELTFKIAEIEMLATKKDKVKTLVIGRNTAEFSTHDPKPGSALEISRLVLESGLMVKDLRISIKDAATLVMKNNATCDVRSPQALSVLVDKEIVLDPGFDYVMHLEVESPADCQGKLAFRLKNVENNFVQLEFEPAEIEDEFELMGDAEDALEAHKALEEAEGEVVLGQN